MQSTTPAQKPSVVLYHYTAPVFLASILKDGLTGGEIPLAPTFGLTGPSLTSEKDPARLLRAGVIYPEKSRVRLTVDIPVDDPLLVPFDDLPARFQHDRRFMRRLSKGSQTSSWFVYLGQVTPDRIKHVSVDHIDVAPDGYFETIATWPRRIGVTVAAEKYRTVTTAEAALSAPPLR